jgi:hypothetical protein
MKLYEHPKTEEKIDRLPEMPEGVVVPEDISGLHLPTALKPSAGGYRWMRWLAAIIVLGATGILAAVLFTGGDNATETAQVEADLVAIDYMELYGTDNPVFVQTTTADLVAIDYMELYGTDNPVFVQTTTADLVAIDYMELYGTDNPVFVGPG